MEHWSRKLVLSSLLACTFLISCGGEGDVAKDHPDGDTNAVKEVRVLPPKMVNADDPRLDGNEYEEKYPDGRIRIKGYVIGGYREGQWMSFYPNGNPWSSSFYKKGKLNGATVTFYENGQMRYKGEYREDTRSGLWTFWDEKGKQIEQIDYSKKP